MGNGQETHADGDERIENFVFRRTSVNAIRSGVTEALTYQRLYKTRFIANSSYCTASELSKLLTSRITAIKTHIIKYCKKVYKSSDKIGFGL